jgi:hypothetical protein
MGGQQDSGLHNLRKRLGHFHNSCEADPEFSHPFHNEREMDAAQSLLTPSVKML